MLGKAKNKTEQKVRDADDDEGDEVGRVSSLDNRPTTTPPGNT